MKNKKYLANTLAISMVAGSAVISPVNAAETNIETLIGRIVKPNATVYYRISRRVF